MLSNIEEYHGDSEFNTGKNSTISSDIDISFIFTYFNVDQHEYAQNSQQFSISTKVVSYDEWFNAKSG